jgi:two-component system, chemotaxis family, sensor kinase CheA
MDDDDEILDLFLEESLEHLDGIEADLLYIEKNASNVDLEKVNKVFRAMHTIKGGSSFFGLTKVKDLTHVAESLLDRMRKLQITATPEIIQSLLEAIDLLNEMLNNPSGTDDLDISGVLKRIEAVQNGNTKVIQTGVVKINDCEGNEIFEVKKSDLLDSEDQFKGGPNLYLLKYDLLKDIEAKGKTPQGVIKELIQLCYIVESKIDLSKTPNLEDFQKVSIPFYVLVSTVLETDMVFDFFELDNGSIALLDGDGQVINQVNGAPAAPAPEVSKVAEEELDDLAVLLAQFDTDDKPKVDPVDELLKSVTTGKIIETRKEPVPSPKVEESKQVIKAKQAQPATKKVGSDNLRVSISLLEDLMSLAGELVLARNQLMQGVEKDNAELVKIATQEINLVTSQLQEAIMKTRMQPIGSVFSKFNRIIRDLCTDLGKDVVLELEGESVELDKTIIESIGDPLTHIIRNSMDHGFETPEERKKTGKPLRCTLSIKAYHEAGKVIIEIDDDGRGVNHEKVAKKAIESGMLTEKDLQRMTEKEVCALIFQPGFSTADQITEVSGRGVGMDVVMTNLTQLGGVVDLNTKFGTGTQIKISLPLTLAIMPSLLVLCSEKVYAVPQVNLVQIVRVPVAEVKNRIQHIGEAMVLRFHDELIPVVRGIDFLEESPAPLNLDRADFGFKQPLHILVVNSGELNYGIVVDQTLDSPEIVVKPFGRHIKPLSIYAGATILGDGRVAPIFDMSGIASQLNVTRVNLANDEQDDGAEVVATKGEKHQLLIVSNGESEYHAIPLSNVLRIERIETKAIEKVGSQMTYDLNGKSVAVFRVDEVSDVSKMKLESKCSLVIFEALGRVLGLLVREVLDSVEVTLEFDETNKQVGIMGSAFINGHLTLLVDLFGVVAAKKPQWVEKNRVYVHKSEEVHKILVVDDSKFFINQISSFLEEAGYKIVQAMNGKEALSVLHSVKDISLVLSDIEMPVMDGLELVTEIRKDASLKHLPVIAVTSVAGEDAHQKGLKLGMDEYLIKLDREEILQTLRKYLYSTAVC